jgi:acetyltransferase-like isoleucine patch superfamily enzyme
LRGASKKQPSTQGSSENEKTRRIRGSLRAPLENATCPQPIPLRLNRLQLIGSRYGWRTPLVIPVLGYTRWVRLRERWALARLRLLTKGTKGRRIRLGREVSFTPGSSVDLGNDLFIGARCTFEVYVNPPGHVLIGSSTWISHDLHLQSAEKVSIGKSVLIGEFVSIRDTTHSYQVPGVPIKEQPDVSSPVIVEDEVWIGRGCLIQAKPPGIVIGRGAIIGANSVVATSIPPMEIWAGAPARLIKPRPS